MQACPFIIELKYTKLTKIFSYPWNQWVLKVWSISTYRFSFNTLWYQKCDNLHLEILNHLPLDKLAAISQTTFSNAFSWMKIFEFQIKFHWNTFLGVWSIICQYWFRYWLAAVQATSHYLNQCWSSSLTHICGTRERWVDDISIWKMQLGAYFSEIR